MQNETLRHRIQDIEDTGKGNIIKRQIRYRQETRSNKPRRFTRLYLIIHTFIQ